MADAAAWTFLVAIGFIGVASTIYFCLGAAEKALGRRKERRRQDFRGSIGVRDRLTPAPPGLTGGQWHVVYSLDMDYKTPKITMWRTACGGSYDAAEPNTEARPLHLIAAAEFYLNPCPTCCTAYRKKGGPRE